MSTIQTLAGLLSKLSAADKEKVIDMLTSKGQTDAQHRFSPEKVLFKEQLEVLANEAKRKVIVCSRRAGKSFYIAVQMLITAMGKNRAKIMYIGLTKKDARRVIWDTLVALVEDYRLPCNMDHHRLEIGLSNGSKIYIEGAKDSSTVERMRGLALDMAVLDEAQSFPTAFAAELVNEILEPALGDYNGTLIIAGTPDPLAKSILALAWQGKKPYNAYQRFHWNITHNTKFPRFVNGISSPETYLEEKCRETGYKMTDPGFRREYLGEFTVDDENALVYGFDSDRDLHEGRLPEGHEWRYVISADIGFKDSDAIVVGAFSYTHPIAYIVESYSESGNTVSEFCEILRGFMQKFNPIKTLVDYAGGGAKVIAELRQRYKLRVDPADKYNPKNSGALLIAAEFRKSGLKVLNTHENYTLISQLENICWKTKKDKVGNTVRVIPDGREITDDSGEVVSDDCADAMLYLFKYLKSYNATETVKLTPEQELKKYLDDHRREQAKKTQDRLNAEFQAKMRDDTSWF